MGISPTVAWREALVVFRASFSTSRRKKSYCDVKRAATTPSERSPLRDELVDVDREQLTTDYRSKWLSEARTVHLRLLRSDLLDRYLCF